MNTQTAIRLTITPDVDKALKRAKLRYPALSDPEIFKVALSLLVAPVNNNELKTTNEIRAIAGHSLNIDGYLVDQEEDTYHLGTGTPNNFS